MKIYFFFVCTWWIKCSGFHNCVARHFVGNTVLMSGDGVGRTAIMIIDSGEPKRLQQNLS